MSDILDIRPQVSICIPAYKRIEYLERLFLSIEIQSFTDFEVIVTDDSPNTDVADLCKKYAERLPIVYYPNPEPLGTPENWNQGIRLAKGEWIKIMHDDDWFSGADSLQQFVTSARSLPFSRFLYSAYSNHYSDGRVEPVYISGFRKRKLDKNPVTLFSRNVIGPPSVVMVHRSVALEYDKRMKWMVDVDYYMRFLAVNHPPIYIPASLVNVGIHPNQVTSFTFRVQDVEIPENFWLLEKVGSHHLKDVLIYDAWWRIVRNLRIDSLETIRKFGYHGEVPPVILSMVRTQRILGPRILKIGLFSKCLMFAHYLFNRRKIQA